MSLLDQFPHLCTIGRITRTNDEFGGNVYGIEIERTNVEVWEQQASASEMKDFEKRGIQVTTKMFFVEDPQLTEQHRILVTSRNGVAAPYLDITDVSNPNVMDVKSSTFPDSSAGLGILWKVMLSNSQSDTQ